MARHSMKKMDKPKALSAMGFSTTRQIDQAIPKGVEEVRRVLDEALFKKQLDIDNKLRKLEEVKHKKEGKKQVEKLYNEKLHLHEAFQYLMRKYSAEAEKYRKQAEESAGGGVEEELSSTNSDAACTELKYFHELSIDN